MPMMQSAAVRSTKNFYFGCQSSTTSTAMN